jgi:hypothetical protein
MTRTPMVNSAENSAHGVDDPVSHRGRPLSVELAAQIGKRQFVAH